jgi:3-methyladenine DNA glycosylase Tag
MADEASKNIEDALNKIVNTTDQSENMRKDLKKTIFETVSSLRNLLH